MQPGKNIKLKLTFSETTILQCSSWNLKNCLKKRPFHVLIAKDVQIKNSQIYFP